LAKKRRGRESSSHIKVAKGAGKTTQNGLE